MPITRVLVANRGEIAVRIIRAAHALGIETVLAVSDADRASLPARQAGRAVCIGPSAASKSYLDPRIIVTAALGTGADAIHPGYGFLAESSELAELCAANGITFVGPQPEHIRRMGNKLEARVLAQQYAIPTLPGSEKVNTYNEAALTAERIGLPVIIKAAAGGGGRGMKVVSNLQDMQRMFTAASAEARAAFGDDTLYLERFVPNARHIEVQLLGDRFGNVIHLGERDCSLQRRHQKIVEEAPAPSISEELRAEIRQSAVILATKMVYENAGTVEFIVDQDKQTFYFLEMNTRIQVEHPITEAITGIDLVQEQFRVAAGERLKFSQADVTFRGHAIECRINAELPDRGFLPNAGRIIAWNPPEGEHIRLETHCYTDYEVPVFYDSLLAKLIVWGADRGQAVDRMREALTQFSVEGIGTTISFLRSIVADEEFIAGRVNTRFVERLLDQILEQSR